VFYNGRSIATASEKMEGEKARTEDDKNGKTEGALRAEESDRAARSIARKGFRKQRPV
jgi:hypothetical protein